MIVYWLDKEHSNKKLLIDWLKSWLMINDCLQVGQSLDKEHSKEYKKLRAELKKKTDNASRLIKKHKKSKG